MIRYNHSKKAPHPYIKFKSEVNNLQRLYGETSNKLHDKYKDSPQGLSNAILQLRQRYGSKRNELYATYQQELDDWKSDNTPKDPPANMRNNSRIDDWRGWM